MDVPSLELTRQMNLYCTQKKEWQNTTPYQGKWLTTGWVLSPICNRLSDARRFLPCLQLVLLKKSNESSFRNFVMWYLFRHGRSPLSINTLPSQRNLVNSFGQHWRERLLHYCETNSNKWRVENFCGLIVRELLMFQLFVNMKLWETDPVFV